METQSMDRPREPTATPTRAWRRRSCPCEGRDLDEVEGVAGGVLAQGFGRLGVEAPHWSEMPPLAATCVHTPLKETRTAVKVEEDWFLLMEALERRLSRCRRTWRLRR